MADMKKEQERDELHRAIWAKHHHRPQRPPDAPLRPGSCGEGTAHPPQSLRGLHCTQAPKARDENPASGAYKSLSGCGRGQRPAPNVLPGAGQRPAEGGTGGTTMG